MATVEELMRSNLLGVFNERDAGPRRDAIARTYTPDVTFSDPDSTVTGPDEIDAKARGLLDGAPGFEFVPDGPVRVAADLGQLGWGFGPPGQPPVVRGVDIALVAHGRITRLWTLLLTG